MKSMVPGVMVEHTTLNQAFTGCTVILYPPETKTPMVSDF